jgi:hypothetical protein
MIQEIMGEGRKIIEVLGNIMKDREFLSLDANGSSRDLITSWKINLLLLNSCFLVAGICNLFMVKELGQ